MIKPHTMIAILLAGGAAVASEEQVLVCKGELETYSSACGTDVPARLCQHGVLMPTVDGNVYALNPANLRRLSHAENLQLLKDLTGWLSKQTNSLELRDWRKMQPSSQDYSAW